MKIIAERGIIYGDGKEAAPGDKIEIEDATAASLIASGFASAAPADAEPEAPAKVGKAKPVAKAEGAEEL